MSVHLCACTSECACMSVPWTHISSQCVVSQSGSGVCECVSRYLHRHLVDIQFILMSSCILPKHKWTHLYVCRCKIKLHCFNALSYVLWESNSVGVHCLFPIETNSPHLSLHYWGPTVYPYTVRPLCYYRRPSVCLHCWFRSYIKYKEQTVYPYSVDSYST